MELLSLGIFVVQQSSGDEARLIADKRGHTVAGSAPTAVRNICLMHMLRAYERKYGSVT